MQGCKGCDCDTPMINLPRNKFVPPPLCRVGVGGWGFSVHVGVGWVLVVMLLLEVQ